MLLDLILLVAATLGLVATWAWSWKGMIIGVLSAPVAGLCFAAIGAIRTRPPNIPWSHLKFSGILQATLFLGRIWLVAVIVGIAIGLAIRTIQGSQDWPPNWIRRHRFSSAIVVALATSSIIFIGWLGLLMASAATSILSLVLPIPMSVLLGILAGVLAYRGFKKGQSR
jgi:hypothetical protein